ncbi:MAG: hypothetical protein ACRD2O_04925 [Terriglobia bacterium]
MKLKSPGIASFVWFNSTGLIILPVKRMGHLDAGPGNFYSTLFNNRELEQRGHRTALA